MQEFLFPDELPFVSTDEELERMKIMYPQYDPYFIASGCIRERREKIEKLWQNFRPYADNRFMTEIKTNFHQRSWEMYIGNVLLEKELFIKFQKEGPEGGPDFIVNESIYIECVAPTKGDPSKPDSVPEMFVAKTPQEIHFQDVPEEQMILRITNAIGEKIKQYKRWKNKKWFQKNSPFIIAINTGDLQYPQDYLGIPLIIKALFGLGFMKINLRNGSRSFSWRIGIKKQKSEVPVNYFTNSKYNFISGILFSDKTVLNHPPNIGDDCIFVNNPFAKNPVNENFIQKFIHWYVERHNSDGLKLIKKY